ncbi:MAG: hypothetical protein V7711_12580 [Pseudomonadales bacterium]
MHWFGYLLVVFTVYLIWLDRKRKRAAKDAPSEIWHYDMANRSAADESLSAAHDRQEGIISNSDLKREQDRLLK